MHQYLIETETSGPFTVEYYWEYSYDDLRHVYPEESEEEVREIGYAIDIGKLHHYNYLVVVVWNGIKLSFDYYFYFITEQSPKDYLKFYKKEVDILGLLNEAKKKFDELHFNMTEVYRMYPKLEWEIV